MTSIRHRRALGAAALLPLVAATACYRETAAGDADPALGLSRRDGAVTLWSNVCPDGPDTVLYFSGGPPDPVSGVQRFASGEDPASIPGLVLVGRVRRRGRAPVVQVSPGQLDVVAGDAGATENLIRREPSSVVVVLFRRLDRSPAFVSVRLTDEPVPNYPMARFQPAHHASTEVDLGRVDGTDVCGFSS